MPLVPCLLLLQAQLEEELEFKNEEIAKLKDHLSHVERGKVKILLIIIIFPHRLVIRVYHVHVLVFQVKIIVLHFILVTGTVYSI